MTIAVDDSPAHAVSPLRTRWSLLLREGDPFGPGSDTTHLVDRSGETHQRSRILRYQSTWKLTRQLVLEAKSQAVWSPEQLLAALLDVVNIGGEWLRCQPYPHDTFWELWEDSATHAPQLTTTQQAQLALEAITAAPGAPLAGVRAAAGGNRGRLDSSLRWLINNGYVHDVRCIAGTGEALARRFWLTGKTTITEAVRALGRALSLGLTGWSDLLQEIGHRTTGLTLKKTRGDLLHDRKMQRRGVRVWLREHRDRLKPYRPAGRTRYRRPPLVAHGPQRPQQARLAALEYDQVVKNVGQLWTELLSPSPPRAHEDERSRLRLADLQLTTV